MTLIGQFQYINIIKWTAAVLKPPLEMACLTCEDACQANG